MHAGASSPSASFSAGGRRRGQARCMPAGDNDPRHDDLLPCLLLHLHRHDDDLSNPIVPVNIYNLFGRLVWRAPLRASSVVRGCGRL